MLLAIALIPLGAAVSKVLGARDLMGGSASFVGRLVAHDHVVARGKGATDRWYTTIALAGGRSLDVESRTLYDAVYDGTRVTVEIRGGGDHVAGVRLPDGRRIPIGDDLTAAVLGAGLWAALGLLIGAVALLLGRRARRLAAG